MADHYTEAMNAKVLLSVYFYVSAVHWVSHQRLDGRQHQHALRSLLGLAASGSSGSEVSQIRSANCASQKDPPLPGH
ncbi:hypothetical protein FGIG_00193 [Fasciola gigantica]|uniref:Uncharacterized protein n=1 Tax=Fasciola gigantica TaxID=46835 RepID=A0A504YD68_FASGI|nr:hypothetical protein FGIG_00193 [Fasciola gigantica]